MGGPGYSCKNVYIPKSSLDHLNRGNPIELKLKCNKSKVTHHLLLWVKEEGEKLNE